MTHPLWNKGRGAGDRERQQAISQMKTNLEKHPYGSNSFKDQLFRYECRQRIAFGRLDITVTKPTELESIESMDLDSIERIMENE